MPQVRPTQGHSEAHATDELESRGVGRAGNRAESPTKSKMISMHIFILALSKQITLAAWTDWLLNRSGPQPYATVTEIIVSTSQYCCKSLKNNNDAPEVHSHALTPTYQSLSPVAIADANCDCAQAHCHCLSKRSDWSLTGWEWALLLLCLISSIIMFFT